MLDKTAFRFGCRFLVPTAPTDPVGSLGIKPFPTDFFNPLELALVYGLYGDEGAGGTALSLLYSLNPLLRRMYGIWGEHPPVGCDAQLQLSLARAQQWSSVALGVEEPCLLCIWRRTGELPLLP